METATGYRRFSFILRFSSTQFIYHVLNLATFYLQYPTKATHFPFSQKPRFMANKCLSRPPDSKYQSSWARPPVWHIYLPPPSCLQSPNRLSSNWSSLTADAGYLFSTLEMRQGLRLLAQQAPVSVRHAAQEAVQAGRMARHNVANLSPVSLVCAERPFLNIGWRRHSVPALLAIFGHRTVYLAKQGQVLVVRVLRRVSVDVVN